MVFWRTWTDFKFDRSRLQSSPNDRDHLRFSVFLSFQFHLQSHFGRCIIRNFVFHQLDLSEEQLPLATRLLSGKFESIVLKHGGSILKKWLFMVRDNNPISIIRISNQSAHVILKYLPSVDLKMKPVLWSDVTCDNGVPFSEVKETWRSHVRNYWDCLETHWNVHWGENWP